MSVKLTGWRRVLPIFYALLLVLLVLWSFWQIGPQFVSNLGKLIDSISASPKLEAWIEDVKKNYQFYGFLFSMFVIFMGLTRWLGKRLWYQETISRRKKLDLPVASLFSSDSSSFSYSSLFQGGLIGVALVAWYFMSVLFVSPGADEDVLQRLPVAMLIPIVTLASSSVSFFLGNIFSRQNRQTLTNSPLLIMSSTVLIGILVSSLPVETAVLSDEKNVALTVQSYSR
jgi:hypothetical protein